MIAAIIGALVLVTVVTVGFLWPRMTASAPTPTAAPTASRAPDSAKPGLPFTMPSNADATGRWQVVSREWSDSGVLLNVRVDCDTATCSYGFMAFSNTGASSVDPTASPRKPELTTGTLRAGESATGYVFLPLPRGAAMLILTTSGGRQISALPITA